MEQIISERIGSYHFVSKREFLEKFQDQMRLTNRGVRNRSHLGVNATLSSRSLIRYWMSNMASDENAFFLSKDEYRAVIRYLFLIGKAGKVIHGELAMFMSLLHYLMPMLNSG